MDLAATLKALQPAQLAAIVAGIVAFVMLMLYFGQRGRVSQLRAERDRLQGVATRAREILATAPDGIFLWDHVLGGITCSRRLAVLLDLEAGTQARYDDIRAKFDAETLVRFERHVSALRGNGTRFDILLGMGERTLQAVAARAEAGDGRPVGHIVWVRDGSAVERLGARNGTPVTATRTTRTTGTTGGAS